MMSPQAPADPSFLTCKVYCILLSDDFCQVILSKLHSSEKDGISGLSSRLFNKMIVSNCELARTKRNPNSNPTHNPTVNTGVVLLFLQTFQIKFPLKSIFSRL